MSMIARLYGALWRFDRSVVPKARLASAAMRLGGLMAWSWPASAGLADLPTWPVSIIAHAFAAFDLDARSGSIWRSVDLV